MSSFATCQLGQFRTPIDRHAIGLAHSRLVKMVRCHKVSLWRTIEVSNFQVSEVVWELYGNELFEVPTFTGTVPRVSASEGLFKL